MREPSSADKRPDSRLRVKITRASGLHSNLGIGLQELHEEMALSRETDEWNQSRADRAIAIP